MSVSVPQVTQVGLKAFVMSILRDLVQKGIGIVALWLLAHGVELPDAVTNWVVLTTVALGVVAWTAVVRFLETRKSSAARALAEVLMLGLGAPAYPTPEPEAVAHLRDARAR